MDSGKIVCRVNPEIPVINPTASHKIKHLNQVSPKSSDLRKVIHSLQDPSTTNSKERHLFVLKKLSKRNRSGFLSRELADLSQILNICAEKASDEPEYAPFSCEALQICRLPFSKERTSDESIYAQDAAEFFSKMGRSMRVPHAEVQEGVVESVKSIFSSETPRDSPDELQPTSPVFRSQSSERSDLSKTSLLSTSASQNQPPIKSQLSQTLQLLSSSSDMSCASISDAGGAETICSHMNEADRSGRVSFCSSEILWNLSESSSRAEAVDQLSSMECVSSSKDAFSSVSELTSQRSDPQLRNYSSVITTSIAGNPNCPLGESSVAKQLLGLITSPEPNGSSAQKLPGSSDDSKTKKLLSNSSFVMSGNVGALQPFREESVVVNSSRLSNPASDGQQEELQSAASDASAGVAPASSHDYMSCQGNTYSSSSSDWCTDKAARGSRTAHMQRCIRVSRSVTASGERAVNQDLCDQGAVNQLSGVLISMEAASDEDDAVAVETMSNIQLILSALCETDLHRKELFGSEGVEMVLRFSKKCPEKFYSGLGHNKLSISTVDCVWSCVVGCWITECQFLAKEGASSSSDVLGASPRCVQGIILSTSSDLCSNPNARLQVSSWRDVGGQTAPRVSSQLWREEEEESGVLRTRHGGIKDPKKPLSTRFQEAGSGSSFPANTPSAAVSETSENSRAKIYLLFCSLGFQELPGSSAGDYVTLCIVRRYLDFKVGEVWNEIRAESVSDGVKPTGADEEASRSICRTSEDTARRTMEEQTRISEEQKEEELREEMLIYTEMKSHRTQSELATKSWDRYLSRTSNYNILKEEKAQRKTYVESKPKVEESSPGRPAKRFVGHIVAVENTGDQGPAGVDVTLARTSF